LLTSPLALKKSFVVQLRCPALVVGTAINMASAVHTSADAGEVHAAHQDRYPGGSVVINGSGLATPSFA